VGEEAFSQEELKAARMSTSDQYPIQRAWKREAPHERVGVDVVGPDGMVVIDVYEYSQPRGDYFLHFTASEWDEIVKAVTEKRRAILARLKMIEDDSIRAPKAPNA
jgi:hypothetical protein